MTSIIMNWASLTHGTINIGNTTSITANTTTTTTSYYESDMAELKDQVGEIAERHGVPAPYAKAIVMQESFWNPAVLGPKTKYGQAVGLMQVMPSTARAVCGLTGTDEEITAKLLDPITNINCGCMVFKEEYERFNSDITRTLAAYNAGPGNVDRALASWPETQKYVYRIGYAIQAFDSNTPKCDAYECLRVKGQATVGGKHDERLTKLAMAIQNDEQIGELFLWVSGFNDEGPGQKLHKEDGHRTGRAMDIVLTYPHGKELFLNRLSEIFGSVLPGITLRIIDEVATNNCIHIELPKGV